MTAHYLLKTEPSDYSYADLQQDRTTVWTGVANAAALQHLRAMRAGDRLLIYETGKVKSVVGAATVISAGTGKTQTPQVQIRAGKPLARPVPLAHIKLSRLFANSPLVRQGRLSVVPLTPQQYDYLTGEPPDAQVR